MILQKKQSPGHGYPKANQTYLREKEQQKKDTMRRITKMMV